MKEVVGRERGRRQKREGKVREEEEGVRQRGASGQVQNPRLTRK